MKVIRSIAGFAWATASIAVAVMLFSSLGVWEKKLIYEGGITTSPRFTGGEVIQSIGHTGYVADLHRPVFDGILGDASRGFIQIDWKTSGGELPARIDEDFDYDGDGKRDFAVSLDTRKNTASLKSYAKEIVAIVDRSSLAEFVIKGYPDARFGVFTYEGGRTVRVLMKKPDR
jgi:hypothetical protein